MSDAFSIETFLRSVAERLEPRLAALADAHPGHPRLAAAIKYALLGGGKRLRPALVLAACEAWGGDPADPLALRFAVALESIHTYSLVHDDLPAMDDDDLRRGRPTVHKAFDEATAILVGDGLQSLAFAHLLASDDPRAPQLARILAEDAFRMVEGQARDMDGEHAQLDEPAVMELMRTKTGALLSASVVGGALCAGVPLAAVTDRVRPIGLALGLAFQIADDLLDLTADTATLGKRAGKDAVAGKSTLPAIVGIPEARRRAEALLAEALEALAPLGPRAEPLRALARFVLSRKK
ncbi:polyprenyl synthetase family protein [Anaeromyxobacter oryzae]|uniref:(2E,6E)-farnesyl diphosphate synthase n=1 Tax=Anaeromyxobacter oryzae TaxID=2918170 RepID=A0ABM7WRG0_9BACT|nr:polyprenyl synthetase family protein [Anaeromyxobacter oryzae]BDG02035.1 (2E,6E)-farnesyl diphosphate synthase [Anaeromyxobacter oryzae]